MRTLLSRSSLLAALLLLPGCASLAQDPQPYRTVQYSAEELDNLVAPVALYPDALLAQILVAATFPDQVDLAAQYVRERGTRGIDDQSWDISVKSVAHYPPVLNMLARDEDWSDALGQAYAAQSGEVMDAVQRLREMAREQGNLVSTQEHTVIEERGRIVIVPANPQVIYVPTYDPYVVYARPIFSLGFRTHYFSFGIGFPIGSWLVYDVDWWGRRVYYDGWYGGGWRHQARRYIHVSPVYVHPRYRVININVNIFSRRVNYINLDRRHRYVRKTVVFERHDRGRDRYVDRDRYDRDRPGDRWRDNDRDRSGGRDGGRLESVFGTLRGNDPVDRAPRGNDGGGPPGRGDRDNDRIGERTANFDDFRPDRGGNGPDARDAEPVVTRSGFGVIEKGTDDNSRVRDGRAPSAESRGGSRPSAPVIVAPPRSTERKATGSTRQGSDFRGAARPESKGSAPQGSNFRGAVRPETRVQTAPPRAANRTQPRVQPPPRIDRGGSGSPSARPQVNRGTSVRVAPPKSAKAPSGGSVNRSSGGGGKVKASGGGNAGASNRGGGGKGRK